MADFIKRGGGGLFEAGAPVRIRLGGVSLDCSRVDGMIRISGALNLGLLQAHFLLLRAFLFHVNAIGLSDYLEEVPVCVF